MSTPQLAIRCGALLTPENKGVLTADGICYCYNQCFLNCFTFVKPKTFGQNSNQMINNGLKKGKDEEKQGERRYLKDESAGIGKKLISAAG